jgi:glycosyltransferase involved in cell wall biosynthesis
MDSMRASDRVRLSLVAPVHDEAPNLDLLIERAIGVLDGSPWRGAWEFVLVDDASADESGAILGRWAQRDARVRVVTFERNAGQSAALAHGLCAATGEFKATLDADLQNDPVDLLGMLELLQAESCDAVVGWRRTRQDSWVKRKSSRVANAVRNAITGDDIRDTGCGLKVFRAEALAGLAWFDGAHRFLPTLLRANDKRVLQHPVNHHPRVAGRSKYGVRNRALRAFVDLLGVRWLQSRALRVPLPATGLVDGESAHAGTPRAEVLP